MPPDLGTSMLFDRLAGRRLEWEARNGVVGRLGAGHGIPTPVTDDVCARLAALGGQAVTPDATRWRARARRR